MVGGSPEIDVKIHNIQCTALLDTGSQITTVSKSFYQNNLSHISLQNCQNLLRIEGVGGDVIPYLGFIVCELTIPLTDTTSFTTTIPMLVVPDTKYNISTPCLIGTNVLSKIPSDQQPLSSLVPHLRSAINILQQRSNHLEQSCGVYSCVTAHTDIYIPPYSTAPSTEETLITVPIRQQVALLQSTSTIPTMPGIINVTEGKNIIPFEIANYTD